MASEGQHDVKIANAGDGPKAAAPRRAGGPWDVAVIAWLILNSGQWIVRRSDIVEILATRHVRRAEIIHFCLPKDADGRDVSGVQYCIPLGFVAKGPLRAMYLTDESGRHLPVLSLVESAHLTTDVALSVARETFKTEPTERLKAYLEALVVDAEKSVQERSVPDELRSLEWNHPFLIFLKALRYGQPLFAFPEAEPDERRAWKFGLDEVMHEERPARSPLWSPRGWQTTLFTLSSALGWRTKLFKLRGLALDAAHYELAIATPSDLDVVEATIKVPWSAGEPPPRWRTSSGKTALSLPADLTLSEVLPPAIRQTPMAELHVELRAARGGVLLAGFLYALMVFALLLGGLLRIEEFVKADEGAAALLVLASGLFGAFLTRPGEHRVALEMLRVLRALILLSASCAVFATYLLATNVNEPWLTRLWTATVAVAAVPVVILGLGNALPRGKP